MLLKLNAGLLIMLLLSTLVNLLSGLQLYSNERDKQSSELTMAGVIDANKKTEAMNSTLKNIIKDILIFEDCMISGATDNLLAKLESVYKELERKGGRK